MANKHALLSPSSASRWLACTPSARLTENIKDTAGNFALEGTSAHTLAEFMLRRYLWESRNIGEKPKDPTEDLPFFDDEMCGCTSDYADFCVSFFEKSDAEMFIERKVAFEEYVPDGRGSVDCLIVGHGHLHVIDLKYGKGVPVSADNNPQIKLYALGALRDFDWQYDIGEVKMSIYQPRRSYAETATLTAREIYEWAEETVKPAAKLAWDGKGLMCAGEHCRWCKIKATCRERAAPTLQYLTADEFKIPNTLTDDEIADVLGKLENVTAWVEDVKNYAFVQALNGKKWAGYKLILGTANRKITDLGKAAELLEKAGHTNIYTEPELLTIGKLEKTVGKAELAKVCGKLIVKPEGKPALVPETHKSKEYTPNPTEYFSADGE